MIVTWTFRGGKSIVETREVGSCKGRVPKEVTLSLDVPTVEYSKNLL